MPTKLCLISLIVFSFLSCVKDEVPYVLLYSNSFENETDLSEYTINFGDIKITSQEAAEESNGCLAIFGMCLAPNLTKQLGPFDQDYTVQMDSWMKTEYGAAIHLSRKSKPREYLRIETREDLFKARKWNHYISGSLFVPKGETLMLYFDASNNTLSNTWIDEFNIIGTANE